MLDFWLHGRQWLLDDRLEYISDFDWPIYWNSQMKPVKNIDKVWKQDTLKREILSWWRQFRPVGWTILAHIENPTVNTGNDWNGKQLQYHIFAS